MTYNVKNNSFESRYALYSQSCVHILRKIKTANAVNNYFEEDVGFGHGSLSIFVRPWLQIY